MALTGPEFDRLPEPIKRGLASPEGSPARIGAERYIATQRKLRSVEVPEARQIPGLPDPNAARYGYSADEVAQILGDQGVAAVRQVPRPGGGTGTYTVLNRGTRGSSAELDRQVRAAAIEAEVARQALVDARGIAPAQVLSQQVGAQIAPEVAARAQTVAQITGLPGDEALKLVLASVPGGNLEAFSGVSDAELAKLAAKVADLGETREDPFVTRLVQDLNREARRGQSRSPQELEAGTGNPATMRDMGDALGYDALARVAEQVNLLNSGATGRPFQQLSAEETQAAADAAGLGKTRGGRRNSLRKEGKDLGGAYVTRTPGGVLSQGMEPSQEGIFVPLLVAPKAQVREGDAGPEYQVPAFYDQQYTAPGSSLPGGYRPSLKDARVLYWNPYAELSDAVVASLGLNRVPVNISKDNSGAYDDKAFNVPIPDTGSQHGFDPRQDPSYGLRSAGLYGDTENSGGFRNPTGAEAIRQLELDYRTPITDVRISDLRGRGADARDIYVDPETGQEYEVFSKRFDPKAGRMLSIAETAEMPLARADMLDAVGYTPREGKAILGAGIPPRVPVASVRIGSPKKYREDPGQNFYAEVDNLISALAQEAFGEMDTTGGGTNRSFPATPLAARPAPVEGSRYEVSDADGGRAWKERAAAMSLPGQLQYGALINMAGRPDAAIDAYQRMLLRDAGFPLPEVKPGVETPRTLSGIIDSLVELANAPASDTPLRQAAVPAQQAVAQGMNAARLLQQAKQDILRSRGGRESMPTTTSARKTAEKSGYAKLLTLLKSASGSSASGSVAPRADLPPAESYSPSYKFRRQPVIPGLESELLQPTPVAVDPVMRDVANYMAARAPQSANSRPAQVVQFVPSELYEQFGFGSPRPQAPSAPLQQTAAGTVLRGLPVQPALPGVAEAADQFLPDNSPLGRLARMMERRALIDGRSNERMGGAGLGLDQPGAPAVSQAELPLMAALRRARGQSVQQAENQAAADTATAIPQKGATVTPNQSMFNAPAPQPQNTDVSEYQANRDRLIRQGLRAAQGGRFL